MVLDLDNAAVDTGWPRPDQPPIEKAAQNPSLLGYKLQSNAYKFSWALIPISVPFVWLMFAWRRRFKVFDHTVFVTYSIASITLLMVALSLIRGLLGINALSGLAISHSLPPIHSSGSLEGRLRPEDAERASGGRRSCSSSPPSPPRSSSCSCWTMGLLG